MSSISHWNYRVLRDQYDDGTWKHIIISVHYKKDGTIWGWSETNPLEWEDLHDLKGTVNDLLPLAFNRPILIRNGKNSDTLIEAPSKE